MNIQLSEHFNYRKLMKFTIPTIAMMIFTSIYGVVDGIFVSNFVGNNAFAAVNLIMPVLMVVASVGFMIGTGGSALVSKTIGEGEKEKANQYFSMLIYVVIIAGIMLSAIGFIFIRPIAVALGAEGEILNNCIIYGRVLLVTLIAGMLQNCFQSFLVVAEKPQMGLMIAIIAGVTNMVLDFIFIYLLKLGVFGAALATGISQVVGGIVPLIYFIQKNKSQLQLIKTKLEKKPLIQSCINGSSEMLTMLSMSLINILYNFQLMKSIGPNGVVVYGIIMYVSFIFSSTYIGYSVGMAPIVSYHYGAENKVELKNLFKKSIILIGTIAIILTAFAEILAKPLASIFVSYDKALLEMTIVALKLFAISFLINGFNIFGSAFFTALNNGVVSATISFLRTLVLQIIMIFLLPALFGINAIWLAVVAAELLALLVTITFLVLNRKKYEYI